MSKRSNLKRLSSVSQEEFIAASSHDFDTWPVLPRGLLVKPSSSDFDAERSASEVMERYGRFMKYFNNFIQVKGVIMLFFFSALIGIIGNLLITVFLSEELIIYNLKLSFVLLVIILILVRLGIMYAPEYSMEYIMVGKYEQFPKGYESFIDWEKIENPLMKIYMDSDYFPILLAKYSTLIRSCRLKDSIVDALKKTKFIKINKISQMSEHYPSFSISVTTNLYAFLHPKNKDKITSEFLSLNGAINIGKIGEGVMGIELDEEEWKKYGTQFVNEISHIDLDEALIQLTDEIKSASKGPLKWRKKSDKISRGSSRNLDITVMEGVILSLYGNWLINYYDKIVLHPGLELNYIAHTFFTLVSILSLISTVQYLIQGYNKKYLISWLIHYASIILIKLFGHLQSTSDISLFFSEFAKMYLIGFGLWGLLPIYGIARKRYASPLVNFKRRCAPRKTGA